MCSDHRVGLSVCNEVLGVTLRSIIIPERVPVGGYNHLNPRRSSGRSKSVCVCVCLSVCLSVCHAWRILYWRQTYAYYYYHYYYHYY